MGRHTHSRQAREDLLEIWLYIAADNSEAADRVLDAIDKRCRALAEHPYMGRERTDIQAGLFSFPAGNYLIFYTHTGDGIDIVRVLHAARDIQSEF